MSEQRRCDGYTLLRPEFMGVTFCRKAGARAAQDVLDQRDSLHERVKALEQRVADLTAEMAQSEFVANELAKEREQLEGELGGAQPDFTLRCTVCGTAIQRTNTRGRPSTVCDADCALARKKQRRASE